MTTRIQCSREETWVNGPTHQIGRFTMRGYTVMPAAIAGAGRPVVECQMRGGPYAWNAFRQDMRRHHGVDVPDIHAPGALQDSFQLG